MTSTDAAPASSRLSAYKDKLNVAIWTTTPWTIPANLAVAVNDQLEYSVVTHSSFKDQACFLVAKVRREWKTALHGYPL